MTETIGRARLPRPYLELGQQALDIPCRTDPSHPFWCEVNMEIQRHRGDVSLNGLNPRQEFLIRALVHGMEVGLISSDIVEQIPRDDIDAAQACSAWVVYQSGALASYEGWLARQWSEADRRLASDTE